MAVNNNNNNNNEQSTPTRLDDAKQAQWAPTDKPLFAGKRSSGRKKNSRATTKSTTKDSPGCCTSVGEENNNNKKEKKEKNNTPPLSRRIIRSFLLGQSNNTDESQTKDVHAGYSTQQDYCSSSSSGLLWTSDDSFANRTRRTSSATTTRSSISRNGGSSLYWTTSSTLSSLKKKNNKGKNKNNPNKLPLTQSSGQRYGSPRDDSSVIFTNVSSEWSMIMSSAGSISPRCGAMRLQPPATSSCGGEECRRCCLAPLSEDNNNHDQNEPVHCSEKRRDFAIDPPIDCSAELPQPRLSLPSEEVAPPPERAPRSSGSRNRLLRGRIEQLRKITSKGDSLASVEDTTTKKHPSPSGRSNASNGSKNPRPAEGENGSNSLWAMMQHRGSIGRVRSSLREEESPPSLMIQHAGDCSPREEQPSIVSSSFAPPSPRRSIVQTSSHKDDDDDLHPVQEDEENDGDGDDQEPLLRENEEEGDDDDEEHDNEEREEGPRCTPAAALANARKGKADDIDHDEQPNNVQRRKSVGKDDDDDLFDAAAAADEDDDCHSATSCQSFYTAAECSCDLSCSGRATTDDDAEEAVCVEDLQQEYQVFESPEEENNGNQRASGLINQDKDNNSKGAVHSEASCALGYAAVTHQQMMKPGRKQQQRQRRRAVLVRLDTDDDDDSLERNNSSDDDSFRSTSQQPPEKSSPPSLWARLSRINNKKNHHRPASATDSSSFRESPSTLLWTSDGSCSRLPRCSRSSTRSLTSTTSSSNPQSSTFGSSLLSWQNRGSNHHPMNNSHHSANNSTMIRGTEGTVASLKHKQNKLPLTQSSSVGKNNGKNTGKFGCGGEDLSSVIFADVSSNWSMIEDEEDEEDDCDNSFSV